MEEAYGYQERVKRAHAQPEQPTLTLKTRKAKVFYISSVVTVISMFFNWLPINADIPYLPISEALGTVNAFTLPGKLAKVRDAVGVLQALFPGEEASLFVTAQAASVVLMVLAIVSIAAYGYAVILRIKEEDKAVSVGIVAALLAFVSAAGVAVLLSNIVSSMGIENIIGNLLGVMLMSSWTVTLVAAIISACCAYVKKVWYINRVYTGMYGKNIEDYPHDPETEWVCSSCNKVNKKDDNFCKCGCGVALE